MTALQRIVFVDPSLKNSLALNQLAKPIPLTQSFENASTLWMTFPSNKLCGLCVLNPLRPLRLPAEAPIYRGAGGRNCFLKITHITYLV
jgi:hypothetical protein